MEWNWQQKDWPHFTWKKEALVELEEQFLRLSGVYIGAASHLDEEEKKLLIVNVMTDESVKTSEIEGEYLNRDSVQSSIRRNFGLSVDERRVSPAESGIADMMIELYRNFAQPLSHATLYHWHKLLTNGRRDLGDIGCYRTHKEPMQVISGPGYDPKIHFEAPPSSQVKEEMDQFLLWFAKTAPGGETPLPPLTRAGITHLYFISIHPFEDGNGRLVRAIAEKTLSQGLGEPTLVALSQVIQKNRKAYYQALERNNKNNEITDWLLYFANTILDAQNYSLDMIHFLIEKTKLFDKVKEQLNPRQIKVMERMFREGLEGFKGGLSAENYISLTGTSRATATRDLHDLIEKGVLVKTGELKSTRYYLNIKSRVLSS